MDVSRYTCRNVVGFSAILGSGSVSVTRRKSSVASEPEFGRGGPMKQFLSYFSVMAGTAVVTLALSSAIIQPKASAAPAPVPVAAAVPAPAPVATSERHPHIDEALEHMRAAKHALETAEHDFDGHRVKSIEHVNASIHEAEICLNMR